MSAGAPAWKVWAVWLSRILSGVTFTVSGWAKAIDPRGFAFKIEEYLNVWQVSDAVPDALSSIGAGAIAIFELIVGILLLTGSLRRSAAICGLVMMVFWLPLSVYIFVADPVADCGCFGDFLVISNSATLIKNIVLTVLLIICLRWYKAARPLYRPGLQWLVPSLTAIYGLLVAIIGWHLQPVVDFRPYPVGAPLVEEDAEPTHYYIYSKDGEERRFSLDELPDSTWTFIRADESQREAESRLAVFDGDDEVTDELFGESDTGEMIVLVFAQPGIDDLMRARMANEIYEYAEANGIRMIGLVAASDEALDQWKELARPEYEVYSSDDTSLKQLVRGPIGIVFVRDGRIVWKRNFLSLPADFLAQDDPFDAVGVVDDGRVAWWLAIFFVGGLLLLLGISRLTTIKIRPRRNLIENNRRKK